MNNPIPAPLPIISPLDIMQDGKEFESLVSQHFVNFDIVSEIRRSIKEIETARGIPSLCYVANVINAPTGNSIEPMDDLPFREMVASVPLDKKEIDIVLVTPGGIANQVVNFVHSLRPRFDKVNFILLDMAMSAGTIFIMSGDEIIMSKQSKFGPIDPQVPNKDGRFVPAQAILTAIKDIQERGQDALNNGKQPNWTDIQILKNIDAREIGTALSASNHSIQITKEFLENYKFKSWSTHKTNGNQVTPDEKKERAAEIASELCSHEKWKDHGHFIDREDAWNECKLLITHSETNKDLDRSMRRMWALFYWIFENTKITKFFISENYCIIRQNNR